MGNCVSLIGRKSMLNSVEKSTAYNVQSCIFHAYMEKNRSLILGVLKITERGISFFHSNSYVQIWPLKYVCRYGFNNCAHLFFFESLRRYSGEESICIFRTHQSAAIFKLLQTRLQENSSTSLSSGVNPEEKFIGNDFCRPTTSRSYSDVMGEGSVDEDHVFEDEKRYDYHRNYDGNKLKNTVRSSQIRHRKLVSPVYSNRRTNYSFGSGSVKHQYLSEDVEATSVSSLANSSNVKKELLVEQDEQKPVVNETNALSVSDVEVNGVQFLQPKETAMPQKLNTCPDKSKPKNCGSPIANYAYIIFPSAGCSTTSTSEVSSCMNTFCWSSSGSDRVDYIEVDLEKTYAAEVATKFQRMDNCHNRKCSVLW